jgi:hypothetical protein
MIIWEKGPPLVHCYQETTLGVLGFIEQIEEQDFSY